MILRGVGDTYLVTAASEAGFSVDDREGQGSREERNSRFILRVYRPDQRSLSQIMAETDLLLALKKGNIPVSWPIADRSGAVIQAVDAGGLCRRS